MFSSPLWSHIAGVFIYTKQKHLVKCIPFACETLELVLNFTANYYVTSLHTALPTLWNQNTKNHFWHFIWHFARQNFVHGCVWGVFYVIITVFGCVYIFITAGGNIRFTNIVELFSVDQRSRNLNVICIRISNKFETYPCLELINFPGSPVSVSWESFV